MDIIERINFLLEDATILAQLNDKAKARKLQLAKAREQYQKSHAQVKEIYASQLAKLRQEAEQDKLKKAALSNGRHTSRDSTTGRFVKKAPVNRGIVGKIGNFLGKYSSNMGNAIHRFTDRMSGRV